jgi:hypothetical protein
VKIENLILILKERRAKLDAAIEGLCALPEDMVTLVEGALPAASGGGGKSA